MGMGEGSVLWASRAAALWEKERVSGRGRGRGAREGRGSELDINIDLHPSVLGSAASSMHL